MIGLEADFFKENTGWSRTMYTEPGQMLDNAAGSGFGKIGLRQINDSGERGRQCLVEKFTVKN